MLECPFTLHPLCATLLATRHQEVLINTKTIRALMGKKLVLLPVSLFKPFGIKTLCFYSILTSETIMSLYGKKSQNG